MFLSKRRRLMRAAIALGRAPYQPGWKRPEHVGPAAGATHCLVEHVGLVVSGAAAAAMADGKITELRAGDHFCIPPEPHDSWVVGDEVYMSLHLLRASHYAERPQH